MLQRERCRYRLSPPGQSLHLLLFLYRRRRRCQLRQPLWTLADERFGALRGLAAAGDAMIRIEQYWLSVAPMDMRCGVDRLLAQVINAFGQAQPHHAYVFANRRASRLKVLVHDGIGVWLAMRRLHQGGFSWPVPGTGDLRLSQAHCLAVIGSCNWGRRPWRQKTDSGMIVGMSPDSVPSVDQLDSEALRTLARQLMQQLQESESRNQQPLHELAILRRHRFGARSEQSAGVQGSLLDETIETDLADIEQQLQRQSSRTQVETRDSAPPKRQPLTFDLLELDLRDFHAVQLSLRNAQLALTRSSENQLALVYY